MRLLLLLFVAAVLLTIPKFIALKRDLAAADNPACMREGVSRANAVLSSAEQELRLHKPYARRRALSALYAAQRGDPEVISQSHIIAAVLSDWDASACSFVQKADR